VNETPHEMLDHSRIDVNNIASSLVKLGDCLRWLGALPTRSLKLQSSIQPLM
jgi:hypothetical protein